MNKFLILFVLHFLFFVTSCQLSSPKLSKESWGPCWQIEAKDNTSIDEFPRTGITEDSEATETVTKTPSKVEAIVVPVAAIGEISNVRKQILHNTLVSKLDDYFNLVSKERLEKAQEKAFIEMDECTEAQCFMLIQEYLQVENLFALQVLGEGNQTQISLRWVDLDKTRTEEDFCEGCETGELRERIDRLAERLVGGKELVQETIVQETVTHGTLYRDTPYAKFVDCGMKWFSEGDEKKLVKYTGGIRNGVPEGKGTQTFSNTTFKFVGMFKDGKKNGQGTLNYSDGRKYVGEFNGGNRHGEGTFTWADGTMLLGEWKNDKPWNATEFDEDGSVKGSYSNYIWKGQ